MGISTAQPNVYPAVSHLPIPKCMSQGQGKAEVTAGRWDRRVVQPCSITFVRWDFSTLPHQRALAQERNQTGAWQYRAMATRWQQRPSCGGWLHGSAMSTVGLKSPLTPSYRQISGWGHCCLNLPSREGRGPSEAHCPPVPWPTLT